MDWLYFSIHLEERPNEENGVSIQSYIFYIGIRLKNWYNSRHSIVKFYAHYLVSEFFSRENNSFYIWPNLIVILLWWGCAPTSLIHIPKGYVCSNSYNAQIVHIVHGKGWIKYIEVFLSMEVFKTYPWDTQTQHECNSKFFDILQF